MTPEELLTEIIAKVSELTGALELRLLNRVAQAEECLRADIERTREELTERIYDTETKLLRALQGRDTRLQAIDENQAVLLSRLQKLEHQVQKLQDRMDFPGRPAA
jgi:chromosome segregation ATPase